MNLLTSQEIRTARVGCHDERYNDTAKRIGCRAADVHRAATYETLTPEERDEIIDAFMNAELVSGIADRMGTSQTAVLKTVRGALIHARDGGAMEAAA